MGRRGPIAQTGRNPSGPREQPSRGGPPVVQTGPDRTHRRCRSKPVRSQRGLCGRLPLRRLRAARAHQSRAHGTELRRPPPLRRPRPPIVYDATNRGLPRLWIVRRRVPRECHHLGRSQFSPTGKMTASGDCERASRAQTSLGQGLAPCVSDVVAVVAVDEITVQDISRDRRSKSSTLGRPTAHQPPDTLETRVRRTQRQGAPAEGALWDRAGRRQGRP